MTEPCDSTWAINATTILRLLGRDPPPPYGPKVEEKDSSIQFTWLDLSLETPDTLTDPPSDVPMYDSESAVATGQAAAEAEEEWDQELCGDIIHREQLKQIVVIDRLSDLRKEFFSVLLTQLRSAEDEPPEAVDAETQNDVTEAPSTGQAELYTEDRPVIVGPDGQHIDLDDDGAEDAPTVDAEDAYDRRVERTRRKHREENADTEPETERKGPNRHCEREVIDIEQSVDQFPVGCNSVRPPRVGRLSEDGLSKMAEREPEEAKAFKLHMYHACIASQKLVRIYDILRWWPTPCYVGLPLEQVAKCYHEQAVLLYRLAHLQKGSECFVCRVDHRLEGIGYAAEHHEDGGYGFEQKEFRNGWTDHVSEFERRQALIHLIASMEVRKVRVKLAVTASDEDALHQVGRRVVRWYEIAMRWHLEQRFGHAALAGFATRTWDRMLAVRHLVTKETQTYGGSDFDDTFYEDRQRGDPI